MRLGWRPVNEAMSSGGTAIYMHVEMQYSKHNIGYAQTP